jgi:hypothetical protein
VVAVSLYKRIRVNSTIAISPFILLICVCICDSSGSEKGSEII